MGRGAAGWVGNGVGGGGERVGTGGQDNGVGAGGERVVEGLWWPGA